MSDPTEEWLFDEPLNKSTLYGSQFMRVAYINDVWVAVGVSYHEIPYVSLVAVSQSPDGPWEFADAAETAGAPLRGTLLKTVGFGDGTWVATGDPDSAYTVEVFTADQPLGPWTHRSSISGDANSLAFHGGTWAFVTTAGEVYATTDPTNTWTLEEDFNSTSARIAYVGGKWIAAVSNGGTATAVWSANSPSGAWTDEGQFTVSGGPMAIGHDGTRYFVASGMALASSTLDGTWTIEVSDFNDYLTASGPQAFIEDVAFADGYYVATGYDDNTYKVHLASRAIGGPYVLNVAAEPIFASAIGSLASDGESWLSAGGIQWTPWGKAAFWAPETDGAGWGLTL